MGTIGVPELVTIATLAILLLLVPIGANRGCGLVIAKRKSLAGGSRSCESCQQRVPDLGSFCPLCGQKMV
jgi:hypothetical protein